MSRQEENAEIIGLEMKRGHHNTTNEIQRLVRE
jgi:hypothetical protein